MYNKYQWFCVRLELASELLIVNVNTPNVGSANWATVTIGIPLPEFKVLCYIYNSSINILVRLMDYVILFSEIKYNMFIMYVSLCGLSLVGCNRYKYSDNDHKAHEPCLRKNISILFFIHMEP